MKQWENLKRSWEKHRAPTLQNTFGTLLANIIQSPVLLVLACTPFLFRSFRKWFTGTIWPFFFKPVPVWTYLLTLVVVCFLWCLWVWTLRRQLRAANAKLAEAKTLVALAEIDKKTEAAAAKFGEVLEKVAWRAGLDPTEVTILQLLAKENHRSVTSGDIIAALAINPVKVQYHLTRLVREQYLTSAVYLSGNQNSYRLAYKGSEYLVKRGLI